MKINSAILFFAASALCAASAESPYAVCAHVSGWEYPEAARLFKAAREAGAKCVRTGANWQMCEKREGELDFSKLDNLVARAESEGIELHFVVPSHTPEFASPFTENVDKLARFAEEAARHFRGRVKYWEVCNEPDIKLFWEGGNPDPAKYAELLKAVYAAIKRGDPNAVVLYGGISQVKLDYIEATLKAGAGEFFDVMNVHPYSWREYPERTMPRRVEGLREVMKKYGVGEKPIWFTEIGYTSGSYAPSIPKHIKIALERLGIGAEKRGVAYIFDERYDYRGDGFNGGAREVFPNIENFFEIDFDGLKNLSPKKHPILCLLPNEAFPQKYFADLKSYLKKGGTVVSAGGVPFYYDLILEGESVSRKMLGRAPLESLSMGVRSIHDVGVLGAGSGVAKHTRTVGGTRILRVESAAGFGSVKTEGLFAPRFCSAKNLKKGDAMAPISFGVFGDARVPIGALYSFKRGGNFIAFYNPCGESATAEFQAYAVAREYILARSLGVDRIYKYSLRDDGAGHTREGNFGIIGRDYRLKPAFFSYKTLARELGNARPKLSVFGDIYVAEWTRPDGVPACAVWKMRKSADAAFNFDGALQGEQINFLGAAAPAAATDGKILKLRAAESGIYLKGVKNLRLAQ